MDTQLLRDAIEGRATVVPITLDKYHRMLETGILEEGDPIELLDGMLVLKDRSALGEASVTVSPAHQLVVGLLADLNPAFVPHGSHLRTQAPISIPPDKEPEPDACVVRGPRTKYRDQHPGPEDVLCIIEVADSSLHRDRTTKLRIYAGAGVAEYIIVNLAEGVVEVYTEPRPAENRYAEQHEIGSSGTLTVPSGGTPVAVELADLLK